MTNSETTTSRVYLEIKQVDHAGFSADEELRLLIVEGEGGDCLVGEDVEDVNLPRRVALQVDQAEPAGEGAEGGSLEIPGDAGDSGILFLK